MKNKITPLMIFGILWLAVVIISWNAFPAWKNTEGGLWILVGVAAIGVIAFLKDGINFFKTWGETQSPEENPPIVVNQEDEKDSQATYVKWDARDTQLVKKYFELLSKYDNSPDQYAKEDKQIEFCISFGLAKRVGSNLVLTQAGVLLFCKHNLFPHSLLHSDIVLRHEEQGEEIEQKKDISGSILDSYFQVYEILKPLTTAWKSTNIRNEVGQEEVFFYYPDVAITEVLVNFFIHRDYLQDDLGYITIYSDRIEFINPGTSTFTPEELLSAEKPLRPPYQRNPRLLQALRKTGLNQSEGRGILRTKDALVKNKSVDPQGNIGLFIENDQKTNRFRIVVFKKIPLPLKQRAMTTPKQKILMVEDDPDVAEMSNAYFRVQGYEVFTVNWGEDGVRAAQTIFPDLIILDIRLPDIDGYEVARRIRGDRRTKEIPIIFLTEKRERVDRLQGFEAGGDDYITKPFDVQELRLRVRNALKRVSQGTLTNPVSGLPEGLLVDERLSDLIHKGGWALLHISVLHLDSFREMYGFVASDDVLRAISLMIHNTMKEYSREGDFLGHIGPEDFVVLINPEGLPEFYNRIKSRLEQSLDYFYPIRDREQAMKRPDRLSIVVTDVQPVFGDYSSVEQLKAVLLEKTG